MADLPPANRPAIPNWALDRLANQAANLRLENSLYGPIDLVLHKLFPAERNFMVKPQALFRKKVEEEADANQNDAEQMLDPDVSTDSYACRAGCIQFIPDFAIVKADRGVHSDKLLSIIEVKKGTISRLRASGRMEVYIRRVVDYEENIAAHMLVFLVIETDVLVYEVDTDEPVEDNILIAREYPITDELWLADLHSIAMTHWNEPVLGGLNNNNNILDNL